MGEVVKALIQLATSEMPIGWAVFMGVAVFVAFMILR